MKTYRQKGYQGPSKRRITKVIKKAGEYRQTLFVI